MGSCEICGMEGSTKLCLYAGAKLQMCSSCTSKMGIAPMPSYLQGSKSKSKDGNISKRRIVSNKHNVMHSTDDLKSNFSQIVANARLKKGWTKEQLASKISEKVNVVKRTEQGHRPSDKTIKKLEKTLGIKLMENHSHSGHTKLKRSAEKGFTMGDYFGKKR